MPTLNTISYARKKFAQKIAVKEVRFLPDDVQRIYDNTDPLTFYAIDGYDDSGLLWACDGVRATAGDISALLKRCRNGSDRIISAHMTVRGNFAIVTA